MDSGTGSGDPVAAPRYLCWPIRSSFVNYVANLPDGRASVSDGASLTATDPQQAVFTFDAEGSRPDLLAFRGDLRLAGHGGLLFVRIAHPRIELAAAGTAHLTIDDPLVEDGSGTRLRLVDLTLVRDGDGWVARDVRLATTGTGLFNDMYPPGTPFDDLRITNEAPVVTS